MDNKVDKVSWKQFVPGIGVEEQARTAPWRVFENTSKDLDKGVTLERQSSASHGMPSNLPRHEDEIAQKQAAAAQQAVTHEQQLQTLNKDLSDAVARQGIFGDVISLVKNVTNSGASQEKAAEAIEKFKNGEIEFDAANAAVQNFLASQDTAIDSLAGTSATIAGVGTFAVLTVGEGAAAPFTGGASLAAIPLNAVASGLAGAAAYGAIQTIEHVSAGIQYKISEQLKDMIGKGFVIGFGSAAYTPVANAATQGAAQLLPKATTTLGQVATRVLAPAIGSGTAGAVVGEFSGIASTLADGGSIVEAIDTGNKQALIGGAMGFVMGAGFEAVKIAAGAPKPQGTTAKNFTTTDGVKIKQYLDPNGKCVAFDMSAGELSRLNPTFKADGLRMVRITPQQTTPFNWSGEFGQSMSTAEFFNAMRPAGSASGASTAQSAAQLTAMPPAVAGTAQPPAVTVSGPPILAGTAQPTTITVSSTPMLAGTLQLPGLVKTNPALAPAEPVVPEFDGVKIDLQFFADNVPAAAQTTAPAAPANNVVNPNTVSAIHALKGDAVDNIDKILKILTDDMGIDIPVTKIIEDSDYTYAMCVVPANGQLQINESELLAKNLNTKQVAAMLRHELEHLQTFSKLYKSLGAEEFNNILQIIPAEMAGDLEGNQAVFSKESWDKITQNTSTKGFDVEKYKKSYIDYMDTLNSQLNIAGFYDAFVYQTRYYGNPLEVEAYDVENVFEKALGVSTNKNKESSEFSQKVVQYIAPYLDKNPTADGNKVYENCLLDAMQVMMGKKPADIQEAMAVANNPDNSEKITSLVLDALKNLAQTPATPARPGDGIDLQHFAEDTPAAVQSKPGSLARYYEVSNLDDDETSRNHLLSFELQKATPEMYEKYNKILTGLDSALQSAKENEPKMELPKDEEPFDLDNMPQNVKDVFKQIVDEELNCTLQEFLNKPVQEQNEFYNDVKWYLPGAPSLENHVQMLKDNRLAQEKLIEKYYEGIMLDVFKDVDVEEIPMSMIDDFILKIYGAKLPDKVEQPLFDYIAQKRLVIMAGKKGVKLADFATIEKTFEKILNETDLQKAYDEISPELSAHITDATEQYSGMTWGHYSTNRDAVMKNGFDLSNSMRMDNRWGTAVYAGDANSPQLEMYKKDSEMIKFRLKDGTKIGLIEGPIANAVRVVEHIEHLFDKEIMTRIDKYATQNQLNNETYMALIGYAKGQVYRSAGYDAVYMDDATIGIGIFDPDNILILKDTPATVTEAAVPAVQSAPAVDPFYSPERLAARKAAFDKYMDVFDTPQDAQDVLDWIIHASRNDMFKTQQDIEQNFPWEELSDVIPSAHAYQYTEIIYRFLQQNEGNLPLVPYYAKQFEKWLFQSLALCSGFKKEYELVYMTTQKKTHKQHCNRVAY